MSDSDNAPWRTGHEPAGATPLSEHDKNGLRLSWVATWADLNAAEAANIAKALGMRRWYGYSTEKLLDDHVQRTLHRAMFDEVWKWAGRYRTTETNIGCDPHHIGVRVRELCENAKHWFTGTMAVDEAGCMFHHELVATHPFANGNGRHARVATDLLLRSLGAQPFTWGRVNLVQASTTRKAYIAALQAADRGDHEPLITFARS